MRAKISIAGSPSDGQACFVCGSEIKPQQKYYYYPKRIEDYYRHSTCIPDNKLVVDKAGKKERKENAKKKRSTIPRKGERVIRKGDTFS